MKDGKVSSGQLLRTLDAMCFTPAAGLRNKLDNHLDPCSPIQLAKRLYSSCGKDYHNALLDAHEVMREEGPHLEEWVDKQRAALSSLLQEATLDLGVEQPQAAYPTPGSPYGFGKGFAQGFRDPVRGVPEHQCGRWSQGNPGLGGGTPGAVGLPHGLLLQYPRSTAAALPYPDLLESPPSSPRLEVTRPSHESTSLDHGLSFGDGPVRQMGVAPGWKLPQRRPASASGVNSQTQQAWRERAGEPTVVPAGGQMWRPDPPEGIVRKGGGDPTSPLDRPAAALRPTTYRLPSRRIDAARQQATASAAAIARRQQW